MRNFKQLLIWQKWFQVAVKSFKVVSSFPKEEKYSLTDQVVRSSRSVAANIAEGWGKRIYENEFKRHLVYAMGSLEETKVWMMFAKDCGYITVEKFNEITEKFNNVGGKIYKLYENWKTV